MKKILMLIAGVTLVVSACAKKQVVRPEREQVTPPAEETKEEPSVRYTDWTKVPELGVVLFAYDKADLSANARAALQKNATFLKDNPGFNVLVEGYCDERGTIEYNLALGQRRATAVRDYYGKLGVPQGRIATISYGEENPVAAGHAEDDWAKNRRAETKVRNK